jgi:hypothetical protein
VVNRRGWSGAAVFDDHKPITGAAVFDERLQHASIESAASVRMTSGSKNAMGITRRFSEECRGMQRKGSRDNYASTRCCVAPSLAGPGHFRTGAAQRLEVTTPDVVLA